MAWAVSNGVASSLNLSTVCVSGKRTVFVLFAGDLAGVSSSAVRFEPFGVEGGTSAVLVADDWKFGEEERMESTHDVGVLPGEEESFAFGNGVTSFE